jgi:hypothetical protein
MVVEATKKAKNHVKIEAYLKPSWVLASTKSQELYELTIKASNYEFSSEREFDGDG